MGCSTWLKDKADYYVDIPDRVVAKRLNPMVDAGSGLVHLEAVQPQDTLHG